MKKHLILFRGNLALTIDRHIKEYERLFREKYGDSQISRITLSESSLSEIENELLALPFFSPMRLVSVRGPSLDEKKLLPKAELLRSLLDTISETSVVLFSQMDHPELASVVEVLLSTAQVKDFSVSDSESTIAYIIDRLEVSRPEAILLAQVVGDDTIRLESEIHKYSLLSPADRGSLRNHLQYTAEVKVFDITDALIAGDTQKALQLLAQALEATDGRILLSSLISTLR